MKTRLFLFTAMLCLFAACSKNDNGPAADGSSATLSYMVNGKIFSYKGFGTGEAGVYAQKHLKGTGTAETYYTIHAQQGVNNVLVLSVVTDSLQNTVYDYRRDFISAHAASAIEFVSADGRISGIYTTPDDVINISVTNYANGLISGTFTGIMTLVDDVGIGPGGGTVITEGKFQGVKVIY